MVAINGAVCTTKKARYNENGDDLGLREQPYMCPIAIVGPSEQVNS